MVGVGGSGARTATRNSGMVIAPTSTARHAPRKASRGEPAQARGGLGHGLRRQDGDPRDTPPPGLRAGGGRRLEPGQGRPRRGRALWPGADRPAGDRRRRGPDRPRSPMRSSTTARRRRRPTTTSADIGAFLRAGIDVCSTAMTPWVWPAMKLNPPSWVAPITEACEAGGASCFTTGIDPGLRQRPVPADPHGPVQRGAAGARPRDPRLRQLRGGLRGRDGDRAPARVHAPPRAHRHPGHVVGRHHPDDGARRRGRARRDHLDVGEVGHRSPRHHGQGRARAGHGGRDPFHPERPGRRGAPHLPRAREPGGHATRHRTGRGATRTTSTGW